MTSRTLEQRFNASFTKSGPDDCWEWRRYLFANGYGGIRANGKNCKAHRVSWELANNEPLGERIVMHTCDNRKCVNPAHLIAAFQIDNVHDMWAKRRQGGITASNAAKTKCVRGHNLDGGNLYIRKGWRLCRTCRRESLLVSRPLSVGEA